MLIHVPGLPHDGRGAVPVHAEAVKGATSAHGRLLQPMGGYFKIKVESLAGHST